MTKLINQTEQALPYVWFDTVFVGTGELKPNDSCVALNVESHPMYTIVLTKSKQYIFRTTDYQRLNKHYQP